MRTDDVMPARNLPGEAVPWGREVENRIRGIEINQAMTEERLKNGNRTTAAVTSELARQLNTLEGFLDDLEGFLGDLEGLYQAIPKTYQSSSRTEGFASSEEWVSVNSVTVDYPEGSDHVEVSAFGSGALAYDSSNSGAVFLQGRILIRGASGPYVTADTFYTASGWMGILTPQHTRSLDREGADSFNVMFQVRAEDAASFTADPANYANLTILASFTG